ncbi:MAG: hypothetical protein ACLGHG_03175 [Gammaproteobacteria bacterium]
MNKANLPDIEIYVRDATVEDIRSWLEKRLGTLTAEPSRGTMNRFAVDTNGVTIPVRIITAAVGKAWTSIWLDSPDTPWADDLACARDCFAVLGREVRCAAGNWDESRGDDPDAFIKVDADGETPLQWKTG